MENMIYGSVLNSNSPRVSSKKLFFDAQRLLTYTVTSTHSTCELDFKLYYEDESSIMIRND